MIRIAQLADIPEILEIYAPYVLHSTATFEYDVPCRREFTRRFETITAQFPWLIWEAEGKILGYAYASPPFQRAAYSWCAEATVYLRPQAQGRGIALALYTALEVILKQQGYQVVYALICGENTPSLRFHEKMGYHICGKFPDCGFKFGRWMALIWMEKRLNVVKSPSVFPSPWQSIVQNTEFFSDILDNLSLS